ncbi:uncharacterized protein RJT20DRAFT_136269 [Scheffersomyces xylosifermentans]|uniref:uncharacterized protein n=1 Tax=Scheffersomyces xylosifermentans TaxID=1304137 RepID=UPI00315D8973
MSESGNLTLEQLNEKVKSLSAIVEKQTQLIAQSGQQLMALSVNDVKTKINALDAGVVTKGPSSKEIDFDDYVTNEDIVQLVGELQNQLDAVEERTTRRTFNALLSSDEGKVAPLTNKDGDLPETPKIPETLGEFKKLDKVDLVSLALFYELIVSEQEQKDIEDLLNQKEDSAPKEETIDIDEIVKGYTDQQLSEVFDDLARYFGLTYRKNKGTW